MIDFKPICPESRNYFNKYLFGGTERGCEYSFANLFLWGRQKAAFIFDHLVLFSQFNRQTVYPFPVGNGDKKPVLDAIIADSKERGIPCRITGLLKNDKDLLEELYPNKFHYHCDMGGFDYVYDINDLADLKGKKYHSKRNHYNKFLQTFPNFRIEEINASNTNAVKKMVEEWYIKNESENSKSDFLMEKVAIKKALENRENLGIFGLVLFNGETVLAITMGSKISHNTVDVHFEKALPGAEGAYAAINCEFAKYIRKNLPEIEFLNREDDMGIEGLRKSKLSYKPHHMVEKCWACLKDDDYEY
ncbi:MAG: DUF2156 domain-containing protein [Clostridia bacterium]|nr:DUF2156 domain-containing protein [Clostridia bacterium]